MMAKGQARMSTSAGIIGEEIDRQAALASAALKSISGVDAGTNAKQSLPRVILAMLGPYSAAKFLAERVLQTATFNGESVQALHSSLLPIERMVDGVLVRARQQGYFDDPDAAEPLRWLETCDEQVKDCMVALESMLDPKLDGVMTAAMEEHRRGETVPLESIL
ncbi:MAG: hypothetical protein ABSH45_13250 [Bryobacteraceae bacterium]|jgi:hypothetical protein